MKHLYLKRFPDDCPSLTSGAKRDRAKHPHLVVVEPDPSGRAKCKPCGEKIAKSELCFVNVAMLGAPEEQNLLPTTRENSQHCMRTNRRFQN
jgi:hypothetical protein